MKIKERKQFKQNWGRLCSLAGMSWKWEKKKYLPVSPPKMFLKKSYLALSPCEEQLSQGEQGDPPCLSHVSAHIMASLACVDRSTRTITLFLNTIPFPLAMLNPSICSKLFLGPLFSISFRSSKCFSHLWERESREGSKCVLLYNKDGGKRKLKKGYNAAILLIWRLL